MTEILFSREAEQFFEDLLISGFADIEMKRLKDIRDAKSIVDGEIEELFSAIEQDFEISKIDKANMVDQLKKVLNSKDYTLLRSAPFKTDILDKYFISSIPIYSYIQLITAMQLGFAIGINRGISSGLSRKRTWHTMVKDVWNKSVRDVHPFQKGDTNQGIKHCMTIVKYLNRMKYRINVSLSDAVILLISAAVHDIGKSLLIKNYHEIVGSNFIDTKYGDLGIQAEWQKPVREIVKYHAGNDSLTNLSTTFTIDVPDDGGVMTTLKNINIKKIAAIFRLCDVSDMSHTRISDIVFNLNEMNNLKSKNGKAYWKLFSRNNIDKLLLNRDHLDIIILPKVADPSHEFDKIKESIRYDNDDLNYSDTSSILKAQSISSEFWIKGAKP